MKDLLKGSMPNKEKRNEKAAEKRDDYGGDAWEGTVWQGR